MRLSLILSVVSFLLVTVTAHADDIEITPEAPVHQDLSKPEPKVIYKKRTKIDFNDAIVEGQVSNPEGVYVVTPPEKQFGSLLKLRPNFHRELIRDSLLMK